MPSFQRAQKYQIKFNQKSIKYILQKNIMRINNKFTIDNEANLDTPGTKIK